MISQTDGQPIDRAGQIGDKFGGLAGPVIAIFAAWLTFLAFWIQYKANEQQTKQFKKQADNTAIERFETIFFELLHLHKENVNELTIENILNNFKSDSNTEEASNNEPKKESKGRHVFFVMSEIFETLLGYVKNPLSNSLSEKDFNDAYNIFFWGISHNHQVSKDFQQKLLGSGIYSNLGLGQFIEYIGVSHSLGHYFRHLFMTVKFVVDSEVIKKYEDKMKYLKILRAQLSNHEQIMLFYNWLSSYGKEWEDDNNKFFTDYKMIHNLWNEQLFNDPFIVNSVNSLIAKYNKNHKGKNAFTPLFEFQGNDFEI